MKRMKRVLAFLLTLVMMSGTTGLSIRADSMPEHAQTVENDIYAAETELDDAYRAIADINPTDGNMDILVDAIDAYLAIYDRLSPEVQMARVDERGYVQSYRDRILSGQQDEGTELAKLAAGHEFDINVVKVFAGMAGNVETRTVKAICTCSTDHYKNCMVPLSCFYPTNFGWSDDSDWIGYWKDLSGTYLGKDDNCIDRFYSWSRDTIVIQCNHDGTKVYDTVYLVYSQPEASDDATLTYYDRNLFYKSDTTAKGSMVTVLDCTNTRIGYAFRGWDTDASADEVVYEANDKFTINDDMELYAVWTPVDNGGGITVTKTRISINGNPDRTTAELGDTIEWEIAVTNRSNVEKTVTLTDKLTGVSLDKKQVTLAAGESVSVMAEYTVKSSDAGKTIYNTIVASTGKPGEKENPEATDEGTEVSPKELGQPDVPLWTIRWMAGYDGIQFKQEMNDSSDVPMDWYPPDPERDGFSFAGWGAPVVDEGSRVVTITAQWDAHLAAVKYSVYHEYYEDGERSGFFADYSGSGKDGDVILADRIEKRTSFYGKEYPYVRAYSAVKGSGPVEYVRGEETDRLELRAGEDNIIVLHYEKHEHVWTAVTEPDCIHPGKEACSCGESRETGPLGHDFTDVDWTDDHEGGCSAHQDSKGHIRVCKRCGGKLEDGKESQAEDHVYDDGTVIMEPTCTKPGLKEYHCTNCGHVKTEELAPTGHDFEGVAWHDDTGFGSHEEGCGSTEHVRDCRKCHGLEEGGTERALHPYGDWKCIQEPDCTHEGQEKRTCTVCGHMEYRPIQAKGHTFVTDVAMEPDCIHTGLTEGKHCEVCGYVGTEQMEVPALGHDFMGAAWEDDHEGGHTEDCRSTEHTRACIRCSGTLEDGKEVQRAEHAYSGWETMKEATVTEEGLRERRCLDCGHKEKEAVPSIPAQTPEPGPTPGQDADGPKQESGLAAIEDEETSLADVPQTGDSRMRLVSMYASVLGLALMAIRDRKRHGR